MQESWKAAFSMIFFRKLLKIEQFGWLDIWSPSA